MAVRTSYDTERDLLEHVVSGPVSPREMFEALEAIYEGRPPRLVLWDMSGADLEAIQTDTMRPFVERATRLGVARPGGRTAVVASTQLQYGLARVSQAFATGDGRAYELKVFRSRSEAMSWLTADGPTGGDGSCDRVT